MYRHFPLFCLALCTILCLFGCTQNQTVKDSWKFTTRQYRAYLNTPATVDMDEKGGCELYELALGESVLEVDYQLEQLIRAMENSDRSPDQNWVMQTITRFPWLSGVALADAEGRPIARYPEYFMKEFDVSPLIEPDPKQRITSLRAYVQQTPLGPEVYLANPVYTGGELRGLVVAYFDPRSLVTVSRDPGSFLLASPAGMLWSGRYSAGGTPVGEANWEDILTSRSCGLLGGSGREFFWTTRYLGNLPIVYAIPTDTTALMESPEGMDSLKRVDMGDAQRLQEEQARQEQEEAASGETPAGEEQPVPQEGAESGTAPQEERPSES